MMYNNPVIRGFHPDPSICVVGEEYYLVVSSFEYFPGIPIFYSRDLVNWTQISNCVTKAEKFPLDKVGDSGGIWAPTIRYHEGVFYVTATLEKYGNFIISAKDPRGEWSDPVWVDMGGIDPSLLFEGKTVYYCTNESLHKGKEEITLAEIDISTGILKGEVKTIWEGVGGGFLEAPHIYPIGEWYYLIAAEGGTNFNHMITMARSKSIWGPYESCPDNPILTNVHDTSKEVQCAGHGDLFLDHLGNWWMVHLATRLSRRTMSHLGRETFLTPIQWVDGWPVVENNRKATLTCDGPLWEEQKAVKGFIADFTQTKWEPEWIFLRNPVFSSYERGEGKLKIHPSITTLREKKNPSFAAVRQMDFSCEINTRYVFKTCEIGDEAGIGILLSSDFHYTIGKRRRAEGDFIVVEKKAEDFYQVAYEEPIEEGEICLNIRADKEFYTFSYSVGNHPLKEICKASTRFLSCELAGKCFTGTVIGLYTLSAAATEAVMEVSHFIMK